MDKITPTAREATTMLNRVLSTISPEFRGMEITPDAVFKIKTAVTVHWRRLYPNCPVPELRVSVLDDDSVLVAIGEKFFRQDGEDRKIQLGMKVWYPTGKRIAMIVDLDKSAPRPDDELVIAWKLHGEETVEQTVRLKDLIIPGRDF